MFDSLPQDAIEFSSWPWKKISPYFRELSERPIDPTTVAAWIQDWDRLAELLSEAYQRLWVATTVDTCDEAAAAQESGLNLATLATRKAWSERTAVPCGSWSTGAKCSAAAR